MRFLPVLSLSLGAAALVSPPGPDDVAAVVDVPVPQSSQAQPSEGRRCDVSQAKVRREWGDTSVQERKDYIGALHCLWNKPPIHDATIYPGVKNRWDDFVATHINYTLRIHNNGVFLSWHRHFVYLWEMALRNECGYKGTIPYWNWALHAGNMAASPLFDGSETSISGDGWPTNETTVTIDDNSQVPAGAGGGCIKSGPFKGLQWHMGPFTFQQAENTNTIPANAFKYNPRCLKRNLDNYVSERYLNQTVLDNLMASPNISQFQFNVDRGNGLGVHPAGHTAIGPAMHDLFTSPSDPAFMLHHSMIDRSWTLWQDMDPENRTYALNGTGMIFDPPGYPPVNLDTEVEFGFLDHPWKLRDLMDNRKNHFCYVYK